MKLIKNKSEKITYHICPRICGGSCDCKKNPLACSPVIIPLFGFSDLNCSSYRALSLARMTQQSVDGVPAADIFAKNRKLLLALSFILAYPDLRKGQLHIKDNEYIQKLTS